MTPRQVELLKKCITALRTSQIDPYVDELVEVNLINGVDARTARSLVEAGILRYDMPRTATELTNDHVRFPTLEEMEEDA